MKEWSSSRSKKTPLVQVTPPYASLERKGLWIFTLAWIILVASRCPSMEIIKIDSPKVVQILLRINWALAKHAIPIKFPRQSSQAAVVSLIQTPKNLRILKKIVKIPLLLWLAWAILQNHLLMCIPVMNLIFYKYHWTMTKIQPARNNHRSVIVVSGWPTMPQRSTKIIAIILLSDKAASLYIISVLLRNM